MKNLYLGNCRLSFRIPDDLNYHWNPDSADGRLKSRIIQNYHWNAIFYKTQKSGHPASTEYSVKNMVRIYQLLQTVSGQPGQRNGLYLFKGNGLSGASRLPACFHDSDDTADLGDLDLGLGAAV